MKEVKLRLTSSLGEQGFIRPLETEEQVDAKIAELGNLLNPMEIKSLINNPAAIEPGRVRFSNILSDPIAVSKRRIRALTRSPTMGEVEQLGTLVGSGLPLDMACVLLTPPLKYETVAAVLEKRGKYQLVFKRSQAAWIYTALQTLISKPEGLQFVLKNRHTKIFGGTTRIDITSGGAPLQLNDPMIMERAKLYAQKYERVIDVSVAPELPLTSSISSSISTST